MGTQKERERTMAEHREYMRKPFTAKDKIFGAWVALAFSWPALFPLAFSAFSQNQQVEKNAPAISQGAQLKGELKAAKEKIEKMDVSASAQDGSTQ